MTLARYMCCIWKPTPKARSEVDERQDSDTFVVHASAAPPKPMVRRSDSKTNQDAVKRVLTDFEKWRPMEEPSNKRTKNASADAWQEAPVVQEMPTPFVSPEKLRCSTAETPRRPNVSGGRSYHATSDLDLTA